MVTITEKKLENVKFVKCSEPCKHFIGFQDHDIGIYV